MESPRPTPGGRGASVSGASRTGRERLSWLPNAITLVRLAALPALLGVLIAAEGPTSALAAWLFAGVAMTDFIDGQLARALRAESRFGRIADPLVDRLLVAVGLVGLLLLDRIHPAGPAALLARDALVVGGYAWLAARGTPMRVDLAGKVASGAAMGATALALLLDALVVDVLFWIAVALALLTLANYVRTALRMRPSASTRE